MCISPPPFGFVVWGNIPVREREKRKKSALGKKKEKKNNCALDKKRMKCYHTAANENTAAFLQHKMTERNTLFFPGTILSIQTVITLLLCSNELNSAGNQQTQTETPKIMEGKNS